MCAPPSRAERSEKEYAGSMAECVGPSREKSMGSRFMCKEAPELSGRLRSSSQEEGPRARPYRHSAAKGARAANTQKKVVR